MNGFLIIDKPGGCTSHDVVRAVRKALGMKQVGHGGTLDPEATGLLLVAAGRATRLFPFLAGFDKTYRGRIRLGFSTDTYDAFGAPTGFQAAELPDAGRLAAAMRSFVGEIRQVPPPYSAKKIDGRPAYKLARARRPVNLKPVKVSVRSFDLLAYEPPHVDFEAVCSSGTYIRSLAHDLGRMLGCGAHLASLRRTAVGRFKVSDAVTLEGLEAAAREGGIDSLIIPMEAALPSMPELIIRPEALNRLANGAPLRPEHIESFGRPAPPDSPSVGAVSAFPSEPSGVTVELFATDGRLAGLGRYFGPGRDVKPVLCLLQSQAR